MLRKTAYPLFLRYSSLFHVFWYLKNISYIPIACFMYVSLFILFWRKILILKIGFPVLRVEKSIGNKLDWLYWGLCLHSNNNCIAKHLPKYWYRIYRVKKKQLADFDFILYLHNNSTRSHRGDFFSQEYDSFAEQASRSHNNGHQYVFLRFRACTLMVGYIAYNELGSSLKHCVC